MAVFFGKGMVSLWQGKKERKKERKIDFATLQLCNIIYHMPNINTH